ncbi:MAG: PRC-barrel domain-containing protein [Anaerolineales bacterium]|nr:PRC-barrel domain-containing protein [Anaerolineales bacterium]
MKLKLLFSATLLAAGMLGTACGAQDNTGGDTGATTVPPVATAAVTLEATDEIGALPATATTEAPVAGGDVATIEPTDMATSEVPATTEALPTTELTSPTTEPSAAGTVEATAEMSPTSSASAGAATSEPGMAELSGAENPISASELMDYTVQNSQGEELGEIEDLMVDVNNEQIRYAVLSFGGFLDIGEKLFAIPVTAFTVDSTNEMVTFDVDQETLENAPGFDTDNWPDFANPEWDVPYRDFWQDRTTGADTGSQESMTTETGETMAEGDTNQDSTTTQTDQDMAQNDTAQDSTTTQTEQTAQGEAVTPEADLAQGDTSADQDKLMMGTTVRASELMGRNIESTNGDDVGEVQDLVVDLNSGRVLYAVLSFGGFANIGDDYYAIPLRVLNFDQANDALVFDVDENMLQNAPSFSSNDWPDNVSPNVGEEAREYWDNELSMR